ncbi:MAG: 16S rRNA (cytidine(1402)-2'-O)-methyltransferase [Planctomycetota bacterium]
MKDSQNDGGWLAMVATPIGNLEDISHRALMMLEEADLIAAEDTRRTGKLCSHFDIHTSMTSYHQHNEHKKTARLLERVETGQKVAVVTDAGTPAISDPGFLIVREGLKHGIEPVVLPGPSALTYAVTAMGFPVDKFTFYGYPPRKSGRRQKLLKKMEGTDMTYFLFVSIHRVDHVLEDIVEVLGPRTRIGIIREATKVHEERLRGAAENILEQHGGRNWKGEIVMGIDIKNSPMAEAKPTE